MSWGVVKLHSVFFHQQENVMHEKALYIFPSCFNVALWPSCYGESCACEHALTSVTDSREVGHIQRDPIHKGPDSALKYVCISSVDFSRNFLQLCHYVTAGFRCKKFSILLELNIVYKMQIEAKPKTNIKTTKQHKEDYLFHNNHYHDSEVKQIFIF